MRSCDVAIGRHLRLHAMLLRAAFGGHATLIPTGSAPLVWQSATCTNWRRGLLQMHLLLEPQPKALRAVYARSCASRAYACNIRHQFRCALSPGIVCPYARGCGCQPGICSLRCTHGVTAAVPQSATEAAQAAASEEASLAAAVELGGFESSEESESDDDDINDDVLMEALGLAR